MQHIKAAAHDAEPNVSETHVENILVGIDSPDVSVMHPATETSRRAGVSKIALAFLAAMGPVGAALISGPAKAQSVTDVDILNFALNLEYIEAEFYLRAVTGSGLSNADITGTGALGGVNGGSQVPFTTALYAQYAANIAIDEQAHVRFLRSALGSAAVARPLVDLAGGFQGAAVAAGDHDPGRAVQSRSPTRSASSRVRSFSRTWA